MNFRKMQEIGENGQTITVTEHIMLKNLWEVYVVMDEEDSINEDDDLAFTLTIGDYTEMGYQSRKEMMEHTVHHTMRLDELLPAPGWKWVGED